MWIPAYVGIVGNELADKEAKKASANTIPQFSKVPYTDYRPLNTNFEQKKKTWKPQTSIK